MDIGMIIFCIVLLIVTLIFLFTPFNLIVELITGVVFWSTLFTLLNGIAENLGISQIMQVPLLIITFIITIALFIFSYVFKYRIRDEIRAKRAREQREARARAEMAARAYHQNTSAARNTENIRTVYVTEPVIERHEHHEHHYHNHQENNTYNSYTDQRKSNTYNYDQSINVENTSGPVNIGGVQANDNAIVNRPTVSGKKEEETKFCKYCGKPIPIDATFCKYCDRELQ